MAAVLVFDPVAFRLQFPAYSDPNKYPDATLQGFWDTAICYISDLNYGWLNGDCRQRAINMMVAHLVYLQGLILAGTVPGLVNSSSVGATSVSLQMPPGKTQFQWWLNLTPYGAQLLALLSVKSTGGFFVGGTLARAGFRQASGSFLG